MKEAKNTTKILIIDNDQTSFQVQECVAKALGTLKNIELIHAADVTEALSMIDKQIPDAILCSDEDHGEKSLLLDAVGRSHPPILFQTADKNHFKKKQSLEQDIMYVPQYETLEGIHQLLTLAAAMGEKHMGIRTTRAIH